MMFSVWAPYTKISHQTRQSQNYFRTRTTRLFYFHLKYTYRMHVSFTLLESSVQSCSCWGCWAQLWVCSRWSGINAAGVSDLSNKLLRSLKLNSFCYRMFKITAQQTWCSEAGQTIPWCPRWIFSAITLTSVLYLHLQKIVPLPPSEQLRALRFCSGDPQQQLRTVKQLFHQAVQLSPTGRCWLTPANTLLGWPLSMTVCAWLLTNGVFSFVSVFPWVMGSSRLAVPTFSFGISHSWPTGCKRVGLFGYLLSVQMSCNQVCVVGETAAVQTEQV